MTIAFARGSGALLAALFAVTAARSETTRTAIACEGDSVQDFKSFNLPAKTVPQTRIYIIDETEKSIALVADGETTPLCDKAKPACQAQFLPAGIRIDYQGDGESLKLIYNRKAATLGEQFENAALVTTFEGHCRPADLPAAAAPK